MLWLMELRGSYQVAEEKPKCTTIEWTEALSQILKICDSIDSQKEMSLNIFLQTIEYSLSKRFIEENEYSITKAAENLGLLRNTFAMRLYKLQLNGLRYKNKEGSKQNESKKESASRKKTST
jgi:DNA-binding NtrC family response regulator